MDKIRSKSASPFIFFLLVFALSIPFWLLGESKLPLPVNLPVSALGFITPFLAASILSYGKSGLKGVKQLGKKAFDYKKIHNKAWYVPTLLLLPCIYILAYAIMRWRGEPLPEPRLAIQSVPVLFLMYFIAAIGEELGWMGYAIDPLQARWGALTAAVILGTVWAIWHIIPYVQAHNTSSWILWQCLYTVAIRVLIVWIYNNTDKSVFTAILFHDMSNLSWSLFPNYGSHYDPFYTATLSLLIAFLVIFLWGPGTLARFRFARSNE